MEKPIGGGKKPENNGPHLPKDGGGSAQKPSQGNYPVGRPKEPDMGKSPESEKPGQENGPLIGK